MCKHDGNGSVFVPVYFVLFAQLIKRSIQVDLGSEINGMHLMSPVKMKTKIMGVDYSHYSCPRLF